MYGEAFSKLAPLRPAIDNLGWRDSTRAIERQNITEFSQIRDASASDLLWMQAGNR